MIEDALQTRCPACETVFSVAAADLERANGRVRCGDCLGVFDAREHAVVEPAAQSSESVARPPEATAFDRAQEIDERAAGFAEGERTTPAADPSAAGTAGVAGTALASADDANPIDRPDADAAAAAIDQHSGQPVSEAELAAAYDDAAGAAVQAGAATTDDSAADTTTADDSSLFRFGDDTPEEDLETELAALVGEPVDLSAPVSAPVPTPDPSDATATAAPGDDGGDALEVDDWDDLLNELADDAAAGNIATTTPLDFELQLDDSAGRESAVDLDLTRAGAVAGDEPVAADNIAAAPQPPLDLEIEVAEESSAAELAAGGNVVDEADAWFTGELATTDGAEANAGAADDALLALVDDVAVDAAADGAASAAEGDMSTASADDGAQQDAAAAALSDAADEDAAASSAEELELVLEDAPQPAAEAVDMAAADADAAALEGVAADADADAAALESHPEITDPDAQADTADVADTPAAIEDAAAELIEQSGNFDADALADMLSASESFLDDDAAQPLATAGFGADDSAAPGSEAGTPDADLELALDEADAPMSTDADDDRLQTDDEQIARAAAEQAPSLVTEDAEPLDTAEDADAVAAAARTAAAMEDAGEEIVLESKPYEGVVSGEMPARDPSDLFAESMILAAKARPRRRGLWLTLSLLLALLLGAQIIHMSRGQLATIDAVRGPLNSIYGAFGVRVTPAWNIGSLCIQRTGSQATDTTLDIETRFANQSDRALPMPVIKVDITDNYDDVIAGALIEPRDYLAGPTTANPTIAAGEQITALMSLAYAETRADKFELSLCYRADNDTLRCAAAICR